MNQTIDTLLAAGVTLLLIPSALFTLATVGSAGGYSGRVPSGPDAMGLIVPFFTVTGSSVLALIATWIIVAQGRFDWISKQPLLPAIAATVVTVGIGAAAIFVWMAWAERSGPWVQWAGPVSGGLAPLCLCGFLLFATWTNRDRVFASTPARVVVGVLSLFACVGYVMGGVALQRHFHLQNENSRRRFEQQQREDAEFQRQQSLSEVEKVREMFAAMSESAPLWSVIAALPDTDDAEVREVTINRAFQVPDFDSQLKATITDEHPRYRHACADLLRYCEAPRLNPQWGKYVAEALQITAAQIERNPNWLVPDDFANPNPIEHLRALKVAAQRLDSPEATEKALRALRHALSKRSKDPAGREALRALDDPEVP